VDHKWTRQTGGRRAEQAAPTLTAATVQEVFKNSREAVTKATFQNRFAHSTWLEIAAVLKALVEAGSVRRTDAGWQAVEPSLVDGSHSVVKPRP
jgi:hypothetical protein